MIQVQDKEQLTVELQNIEKAIQASETLRQRAITSKELYEQQLKETESELKSLGTTAEKAEQDLRKIDEQIASNLQEIKNKLPFDLLQKYGLLK